MRLLVVEDEPDLAQVIKQGLTEEGFAVDLSTDGEDGLWRATTVDYDVAVIDIVLPVVSGLDILRRMRTKGSRTPVLLLTARDGVSDRVRGLDAGADDYLVKPFAWDELLARIRALLRRGSKGGEGVLRHLDIEVDPASHRVRRGGKEIELTAKEFEYLHLFMREPGRVITRTEIIERLYDDEFDGTSNIVDVFLSRLRRKLGVDGSPPLLNTVRGVGYLLGGDENGQQ